LQYGGAEDQTSHAQPGYNVEYNEGFELLASHPGIDLDVLVFDYDWATGMLEDLGWGALGCLIHLL
jgi:hypothetical protein